MPENFTPERIHDYIQSLREKRHITVQTIAEETKIAKGTLDNFFAGTTKDPKFINIARIVFLLGGSLDEMVGIKHAELQPVIHKTGIEKEHVERLLEREEQRTREAISELKEAHHEKEQELKAEIANERRDKKVLAIAVAVLVALLVFVIIDCLSSGWGLFSLRGIRSFIVGKNG